MRFLAAALWAEMLKLVRSKVPLVCAAAFCLGPVFSLIFMSVLANPQLAGNMAAMSGKLGAEVQPDWATHLSLVSQTMAVGGAIVFGFLTAWIFGREIADRTAKDLLALPVRRNTVMAAKLIASLVGSFAISIIVALVSIAGGFVVGLSGNPVESIKNWIASYLGIFGLSAILLPPIAFVASAGRGYLPALGAVILATVLAQIVGSLGGGAYFPWAVPALMSGMAGAQTPLPASYVVCALVSAAGIVATFLWWEKTDHK